MPAKFYISVSRIHSGPSAIKSFSARGNSSKRRFFYCIKFSIFVSSCGYVEIGRQARLRILCPVRVGSSPTTRTSAGALPRMACLRMPQTSQPQSACADSPFQGHTAFCGTLTWVDSAVICAFAYPSTPKSNFDPLFLRFHFLM